MTHTIKTKYGSFYLEATVNGLSRLHFPAKELRPVKGKASSPVVRKTAKLIEQYFEGKPISFERLKMDLSHFTASEQKVLRALAKVRRGQVVSYQQLAEKAGFPRAARFVGSVMRKNRLPLILPCHRVLTSGGALGGYSCGIPWKKRLLKLEGVKYNFPRFKTLKSS